MAANVVTPAPKINDPRRNTNGSLKLGKKIATILVGEEEEIFSVHHDLITASSDFFNNALNKNFAENTGTVKLQNVNATTFGRYIQWLYSERILVAENMAQVVAKDWDTSNIDISNILDLLILGNFLQDNCFSNAATDHLIYLCNKLDRYPTSLASKAYRNLPHSHPFLTLLVDFWVFVRNPNWLDATHDGDETVTSQIAWDEKHGPVEFWTRIALGLMQGTKSKDGSWPWQVDRCKYHQHETDEPKCH